MINDTTITAEDYADAVALWNKLVNPMFINEEGNPTITWDAGPGVDNEKGIPNFPTFQRAVIAGGEGSTLSPLVSETPSQLAVTIMLEFLQEVEGGGQRFGYSVMPD